MNLRIHSFSVTTALLTELLLCGCGEKPVAPKTAAPPKVAKSPEAVKPAEESSKQPAPAAPVEKEAEPLKVSPIEDPPVIGTPQAAFNFPRTPLEMPKVLLSDAEKKSSLVKVGDTMPEVALPDLDGKAQKLSALRGEKLTVVAFWNSQLPYAVEEIGDLGPLVDQRFGSHGVKVVGVCEKDTAAAAKATAAKVGAKFVNLVDPAGKEIEKVATGALPRTYLLDAQGKVLWFDMEYSRSTRRDLVRAIQFALLNDK